jgi:hypothetical protein
MSAATAAGTPADKKPEPSEQDKAQARQWGKRLTRALEAQTKSKQEERFKKLRKYVRGEVGDDGKGGLVRTNIIHANFAAILPQIYAKNPEIAVTPSEAAGEGEYPWVSGFCKTMQAVLNRKFIKSAHLKKRAKSAIRSAMTTSVGWAKVSWQKDVRKDPLIENRIADSQDNLQRIRHLISEIKEGDGKRDELEAQQAELQQQIAALEAQVEVSVVSGLVIDRPLTEDVFILDDTLYDFDGYDQAEAIAHRVWMTCDQYKEAFGKEPPKTANRYGSDKKDRGAGATSDDNAVALVAVFEVWHRLSNTVFTLCAGADEWARDPYQPEVTGQRFYPFFALAFNPTDGKPEPLSDTELLIELQDEYNTTRTNFAEHRKENLPTRVYRKSGALTDQDVTNLSNRRSNEWIGVEGDPTVPLEQDVLILQNPPIDAATYDVQPILRDAEMVLGAGDAAKGTINKAKTATEAEIMAQGLQSRVAERQDVVEDWVAEMARYAAELALQEMSAEDVRKIAGKQSVWPQLTKDQVFDLVQIDIRAGSTGRPNQAREREQWVQLLPEIQKAVAQVGELRQNGQNDMADTVIKLLEETLRRFDERIDIESFIPQKPEGAANDAPTVPPEVQQQLMQLEQAMQALQAQNQELQKAAVGTQEKMALERDKFDFDKRKAVDEMNARADEAERAATLRLEEVRIKAEADASAKIEIERIRAESKAAELASQERIAMCREMMGAAGAQQNDKLAVMLQQMQQAMASMAQHFGPMSAAETTSTTGEPHAST